MSDIVNWVASSPAERQRNRAVGVLRRDTDIAVARVSSVATVAQAATMGVLSVSIGGGAVSTLSVAPFMVNGNAFATVVVIALVGLLYIAFDLLGVFDKEDEFLFRRSQDRKRRAAEEEAFEDIDDITRTAMADMFAELSKKRR
jgi:hypothetical protein